MLFNSFDFGLFLPIVFILYWSIGNKRIQNQNLLLLAASYFFYGVWDWRFLLLILASSLVDFYAGKYIHKAKTQQKKRLWLYSSLTWNLGVLFVFKYYNFFLDTLKSLFEIPENTFTTLDIIIPVGLSFYTFQTIGYTVDVYRKKIAPSQDVLKFLCFVSFFPQLVAGPIERASKLLPQFSKKRTFEINKAKDGLRQVLWGLFKKIVVADTIGVAVFAIYDHPENYGSLTIIYGAFLFLFQLYADFSGYSDIAIGTAKLFGFDLSINFKLPYLANSVTGFWRTWHITLSKWFQDYVYVPFVRWKGLGFLSKSSKKIIGLLLTMGLIGLWHGANWTYLCFGLLHGILIIIEGITIPYKGKRIKLHQWLETGVFWSKFYTVTFLVVSLIFFRASSLEKAVGMLKEIITQNILFYDFDAIIGRKIIFLVIMIIAEVWRKKYAHPLTHLEGIFPKILRWGIYYCIIFAIIRYGRPQEEFIYFQF
ncbi:MBOAT family O-acyltransferase [Dokdonia ponticola]|uniref:MBOAT family O-acyltransferase n=1 Tax=Dokdonia ponticola TaxID=2041041 RepID=A0ABV9HVW7_9FLAO